MTKYVYIAQLMTIGVLTNDNDDRPIMPSATLSPTVTEGSVCQAVDVLPWSPATIAVAVANGTSVYLLNLENGKVRLFSYVPLYVCDDFR